MSRISNVSSICYDPYAKRWRLSNGRERSLIQWDPSKRNRSKRSASWTWDECVKGWLSRRVHSNHRLEKAEGLIVPELYNQRTLSALPQLFERIRGRKIAIFHDAVALRHPDHAPLNTRAYFPQYLKSLTRFDGIAANSEASRNELLGIWHQYRFESTPPVIALPLATDFQSRFSPLPALNTSREPLRILCVGTIEGRKNHVNLLKAAQKLWDEGLRFELTLAGALQARSGAAAMAEYEKLKKAGYRVSWLGSVSEKQLEHLYQSCHLTVYPSQYEGFGLPVLESQSFGRPCLCGSGGGLKEVAAKGGCFALESVETAPLAAGLRTLITNPQRLQGLSEETRGLPFRDWSDYARELIDWMGSL